MDDREWEMARRLNLFDLWCTRAAWVIALSFIPAAFVMGALHQVAMVFSCIAGFVAGVLIARWVPPMIEIDEVP